VASWNAWTVSGLARAGSLLGDATMLADAADTAAFVLDRMRDDHGRLLHVHDEGRARVLGFLEDVAGMLEATLDLYRALSGSPDAERWLAEAGGLAEDVVTRFWDAGEQEIFLTPADGERLVQRPRAEPDGATPHAAGQAALGLVRAAALAGRPEWERVAASALRAQAFPMERLPEAYPTLARAAALLERGVSLALVRGFPDDPATSALAARARHALAPEDAVVVLAPGAPAPPGLDPTWVTGREAPGGRATAWVCRGTTCSLPVHDPEALLLAASPSAEESP
jgi:uncharacterized protein YyaL (SSP411 family)